MLSDISTRIQNQLNEPGKETISIHAIDNIVYLYNAIASDYEKNVFDRVHHVDLFFQTGFDNYVDSKEVSAQIIDELKKDSIMIDEQHILKIIRIIRENSKE
jgi:hypothetical protein